MPTEFSTSRKVVSIERLESLRGELREAGKVVVQCHGCFDIVHPGHIRHLQHAARLGDVLVVSITGDAGIDKGTGRPLIPQELRADNLAALDCVDWVVVHPESTAEGLLGRVMPDVYVKGREYASNHDARFRVERETVERGGGRVVFTSGDVVFSSTALIAALEESLGPVQATLRQLVERHEITCESVDVLVEGFRGKRVCVVGETIVDSYVMCDRPVVAGESPVMTLRPVEKKKFDGGAAIVARHLAAMGAHVVLVSAFPRTSEAAAIRERLGAEGIKTEWMEVDEALVEKERYLVGQQKVMKVDHVPTMVVDGAQQTRIVELADEASRGCDAGIIVDYGGGLLGGQTVRRLCESMRAKVGVLAGDVSGQRANLLQMRGMDLVCPSESELREAMQEFDEGLSALAWRMLEQTGGQRAIVTLGEEGLIAFGKQPGAEEGRDEWRSRLDGEHVPALTSAAVDVLGCGDALLSAAVLALSCGASLGMAAVLGGVAASAQARRLGNVVIGSEDLRRGVAKVAGATLAVERGSHAKLVV
ncbi:MAG: PfkB family carbohydrate kinase [Planctomycetota bacterium]|jgi:rfaE bifunctional protein kinase chain/domain/rfaE bifunctional protein nucleotidyltransferase chain/domain